MAASLSLPDLSSLTGSRDGVLGAIQAIGSALPDDPSTLTAGLNGHSSSLQAALDLDVGSLTGGVTDALGGLTSAIPSGSLPELQQLLAAVAGALGTLDPFKQALSPDGDLLDLQSLALKQSGDPTARVTDLLGQLTDIIPADAIQTLETFVETVTAFEAAIPTDTGQVAEFLARGFLGVPHDLLDPARAALDGFLSDVTALAPQPGVDAMHAAAAALAVELGSARTLVLALDPADVPGYAAVVTALTQLRAHVHAFADQVASLVAAFRTGLGALNPGAFVASLESALAAVPEIHAPDTGQFLELVTGPIRRLNELADTVTPEQVALLIRGWSDFAEQEVIGESFDEISALIRKPFEEVGHLIEGLHLEVIREAFQAALAPVHDAITGVTGALDSVRQGLVEAIEAASTAVGALTTAAGEAETALNEVAAAVQTASASVDLTAFHDEALALVTELSGSIGEVVGEAGDAVGKLRELVDQLGEVDLHGAASAATDAIGRLTEVLASIDTTSIPEALLSELRSGLSGFLDQISLQPVHDAIQAVLDAAPLDVLDEFTEAFDGVLHELEGFSPTGLLQPLEAPFDEVIRQLNDLRPGALLDPVIDVLQEAKTSLDGFAPAVLLAPLDAPLAEARSALEQVAPEHLLAPLHGPFTELMTLVDKLDGKAALDEIQGAFSGWLQQGFTGLQGLGDAFGGATGTKAFVEGAASGALPADFGLRPGDILKPVEELYDKVVALIHQVPAERLVAAFEQVRGALVGTLDALAPGNLHAHVHGHVESAIAAFDVVGDAELVAGLFAEHAQLVVAVDSIDPARVPAGAAAQHTQLLSLTVDADPRAALAPVVTQLQGLRGDALGLATSLDTGVVAGGFGAVAARLDALIPDFLREPVTVESLEAALDGLNPKHLADEVNAEFELLIGKLLKFAEMFGVELPKAVKAWTDRFEHGLDGIVRDAFEAVHAPLKAQLASLDPAGLEADLNAAVYAPIQAALDSLSLEGIVGDAGLTASYDGAKAALGGVLESLQNLKGSLDTALRTALDDVTAISPRGLEADLQQAYAPIAQALGGLDLGGLADELKAQFQRIGDEAADVLQEVLEALKALVDAIPHGVEDVSASADVSFGLRT